MTIDGTDVIAYRVIEVKEGNSILSQIPERFMSNCHGFAFADGQLWFNDPWHTPGYDETSKLMELIKSNTVYKPATGVSDADIAVIWTDNGNGFMWHSARVVNGGFIQKSDHNTVFTSPDESSFFNEAIKNNDPNGFVIRYYKFN